MDINIKIAGEEDLDGVVTSLMLGASGVFHELFPDDWNKGMRLLCQRIGQMERSNSDDVMPMDMAFSDDPDNPGKDGAH